MSGDPVTEDGKRLLNHDCVIVGQGLAGTTLAWSLMQRGCRVMIIDRGESVTASRIAAGLITPVTGQRLVTSWRLPELLPSAVAFYRQIESELGVDILHERRTARLFASDKEQAFFEKRQDTEFQSQIRRPDCLVNAEEFSNDRGGFELINSAQLDVAKFLGASRSRFEESGCVLTADIDPQNDIDLTETAIELPNLNVTTKRLIFCQGFEASRNPFFQNVPFDATKGEILTLRIPKLTEERIVNRGVWLAPIGNELFRAGSTYDWQNLDCVPSAGGRESICSRLREFLKLPFEVVSHSAAIRPIIVGRHPVIGLHSKHPQVAFFNGLGSKGSLQAPFFARQLAAALFGNGEIDSEVDLRNRISDSLSKDISSPTPNTDELQTTRAAKPVAEKLTTLAHAEVRKVVRAGDAVIDATAGNGHDTKLLAELVEPDGTVFSFDIQQTALDRTAKKLKSAGLDNTTLICGSHSEIEQIVPRSLRGRIAAIMFNLGYLPNGDRSITTSTDSTISAIRQSTDLLSTTGVLTILAYTGHPGGEAEADAVQSVVDSLSEEQFDVEILTSQWGESNAPRLFIVRRSDSYAQ